MVRNYLYVLTIRLLLISSSDSKKKFFEIEKALKKINDFNIVKIYPKDFESVY